MCLHMALYSLGFFLPFYETVKAYVMKGSEVNDGIEAFCKGTNHY